VQSLPGTVSYQASGSRGSMAGLTSPVLSIALPPPVPATSHFCNSHFLPSFLRASLSVTPGTPPRCAQRPRLSVSASFWTARSPIPSKRLGLVLTIDLSLTVQVLPARQTPAHRRRTVDPYSGGDTAAALLVGPSSGSVRGPSGGVSRRGVVGVREMLEGRGHHKGER
jgi:hypothetical protein